MRTRTPSLGSHDEDLKRKLTLPAIRRVLALALPYKFLLGASAVLMLVASSFQLAIPLVGRMAVDKVTQTRSVHDIDFYSGMMVLLVFVTAGISYVQFVMSAYAGNKIIKELRERLFAHMQSLPVAFFDRTRSGDLGSHLSNDVGQLQQTLTDDIAKLLGNLLTLFGGMIIALKLNWQLTIVSVIGLVFVMAFFVTTGRGLRKTNRAVLDAMADAMGTITEALVNIRLVKAFARERYEDERASQRLDRVFTLSLKSSRLEGMMGAVGIAGSFLLLVSCAWFGGRGVITGQFTVGEVAGFVMVIFVILQPMAQLAALVTRLQRAVGASERLFAILDEPAEAADPIDAVDFPKGAGEVVYQYIDFSYVSDTPVLTNLHLNVPAGRVTAIVGPSGAGKTTLASLLYRFYEPQVGKILIDGVPIPKIKRRELRENVGIVPQEPILFNGTIRENIRYGRLDATDQEIEEAARKANVEEFVSGFPRGYETVVGERGITLSGGQRQRVAIARAVLKNPKILILDEATSALDMKSETLVREALDRLLLDRTTLVIAHRLSTVRSADKIAVVAEGQVLETGIHEELLVKGGAYAELYELVDA